MSEATRPSSFFKYVTANTAKKVISNGTLLFSRPGLFNDDFDMRVNLAEEIDRNYAVQAILDGLWEAQSSSEYKVHPESAAGKWISLIRATFPRRADRIGFDDFMRPTIEEYVDDPDGNRRHLYEAAHRECSNRKSLCLSSSPTIGPMWGMYADTLRGAVLEFAPISDDSIFLMPRRVEYLSSPPAIFTTDTVVEMATGKGLLDHDRLHEIMLYTKSDEWSYENEWRMVAGDGWEPENEREFVQFQPPDLIGLIFGTRAGEQFRNEVSEVIEQRYPNCSLKQLVRPDAGMNYTVVSYEHHGR